MSLARSQKKQSPALLKNEAVLTQPIGKTHAEGEGLAAGKRRGHSGLSSSSASCAASTTLALCKPTDMDLLRYSSIASSSTRSQKPTSPENLNPKQPHLQVSEHLFCRTDRLYTYRKAPSSYPKKRTHGRASSKTQCPQSCAKRARTLRMQQTETPEL